MRATVTAFLIAALACGGSSDTPPADQAATPPAPPPAQPASMCALLTQAEAEAILGKSPAAPEPQANGSCSYSAGDIMIATLPRSFGSAGEFTEFAQSEVKRTNERAGQALMAYEPVAMGDAAFYDSFSLHILKGAKVLTIVADKAKALLIAEKALPRF
jgi:hypothetical protein